MKPNPKARQHQIEHGVVYYGDGAPREQPDTARMILSDDPRIWRPLNF